MTRQTTSLIEILEPPENRWLKDLSKRKASLPHGVRVVRFSDEELEIQEGLPKAASSSAVAIRAQACNDSSVR